MPEPLLTIADLTVEFPTAHGPARAVDRVSLAVARGEVLGVVGESGCGKSMTALSVLRLVPPPGRIASGEIRFIGQDLLSLPLRALQALRGRKIAMIFQEPMTALNPVLTVGEQIAEMLRLHLRVSRSEAKARAIELLRLVRIPSPEKRWSEYPHQLSGGMRQRVMIAMAVSCEPDLVFADEPTTALDVTVQAQILDLLADLRERLGAPVKQGDAPDMRQFQRSLGIDGVKDRFDGGGLREVSGNHAAQTGRDHPETFAEGRFR